MTKILTKTEFFWDTGAPKPTYWQHTLTRDHTSPVVLQPGKPLTLGRHRSNDIRIRSPKASRRHARIDWNNGLPQLVDLNSHNGVFLNGLRVEAAPIRDGDELGIANFLAVYRRVRNLHELENNDLRDFGGLSTSGDTQMFSGQIDRVSVFEILLRLSGQQISGYLRFLPRRGEIVIYKGRPIAAYHEDRSGDPALLTTLALKTGSFIFFPEETMVTHRNLKTDFSELMTNLVDFKIDSEQS